jgi:nucleotide-binding universal stress UspA family protein
MSRQIKNILVGAAAVADDPVLRPAVELARRLGETLHVVHADDRAQPISPPAPAGRVGTESLERYRSSLRGEVERLAASHPPSPHEQ